ncbi:MAG: DUF1844 domain-containing protein [Candidatus Omnitrophota bacterium]
MEEQDKNIDETWKKTVEREKENLNHKGGFATPEADFNFFVTTIALQASINLGAMENPATGKKEENLPQAKFIIDTLAVLKEKTKGNLTQEEGSLLENVLYELRMQYITKSQKGEGK